MAAVDFDLRFTYVVAGWEGSAHDAVILNNALQCENGLIVPESEKFEFGFTLMFWYLHIEVSITLFS